jgi:hypothetical protein
MRQKMNELQPGTAATAPKQVTPGQAAQPVPQPTAATQPAVAAQPAPTPEPVVNNQEKTEAEKAARSVASKKPKKTKQTATAPAFQPLPGPDLPISADKQQRLADLLQKYKADEISPEQYHQQRAKILAEP